MNVRLVSITPEAEKTIMYCARVSSADQANENPKLLGYCIKHGHHSVFEMANMIVEITTSRAIAAQILRHRSFSFQEFSQRYAEISSFEETKARRQDLKNRQNSTDDLSEGDKWWFLTAQIEVEKLAIKSYNEALDRGIAKECARMLLPLSTQTRLYMNGTIRSWLHYLDVRRGPETQLEHRDIANKIKDIFSRQLPVIAAAKGWTV